VREFDRHVQNEDREKPFFILYVSITGLGGDEISSCCGLVWFGWNSGGYVPQNSSNFNQVKRQQRDL